MREEKEHYQQAVVPHESYHKLVEFCTKFGIKTEKVFGPTQNKSLNRMKLVESLCLNVDNSFLNYKGCGSVDKTLTKMKLLKPKMVQVSVNIEKKLE